MCARYTLRRRTLREVAEALDAEFSADDEPLYEPRFNTAPTDLGWVVTYERSRRVVRRARWRYETAAKRLLINIRGETISMGRFGEAFAKLRCAVITDGFYEWPAEGGEPVWLHAPNDGLVLLGGLLQLSKVEGVVPRFSILTTRPNQVVAQVHDRMPVVVSEDMLDTWLTSDPSVALQMLAPASPEAVIGRRVSSHVNNVKHDDVECIAPPRPNRQASLF